MVSMRFFLSVCLKCLLGIVRLLVERPDETYAGNRGVTAVCCGNAPSGSGGASTPATGNVPSSS